MAGTQSSKAALFKTTISAAFVTVARLTSFDGPGITAEMLENKVLDGSTAVAMLPSGYTTQQPFVGKGNLDPSGTTDKFCANSVATPPAAGVACKIVWPDGTTEWTWTGNFTRFMPHAAAGQPLTVDIENQPQGAVTLPA